MRTVQRYPRTWCRETPPKRHTFWSTSTLCNWKTAERSHTVKHKSWDWRAANRKRNPNYLQRTPDHWDFSPRQSYPNSCTVDWDSHSWTRRLNCRTYRAKINRTAADPERVGFDCWLIRWYLSAMFWSCWWGFDCGSSKTGVGRRSAWSWWECAKRHGFRVTCWECPWGCGTPGFGSKPERMELRWWRWRWGRRSWEGGQREGGVLSLYYWCCLWWYLCCLWCYLLYL